MATMMNNFNIKLNRIKESLVSKQIIYSLIWIGILVIAAYLRFVNLGDNPRVPR